MVTAQGHHVGEVHSRELDADGHLPDTWPRLVLLFYGTAPEGFAGSGRYDCQHGAPRCDASPIMAQPSLLWCEVENDSTERSCKTMLHGLDEQPNLGYAI